MKSKNDFEKLNKRLNDIIIELESYNEEIVDYGSGRSESFIKKRGDNLDSLSFQLDRTIENLCKSYEKVEFVINDF